MKMKNLLKRFTLEISYPWCERGFSIDLVLASIFLVMSLDGSDIESN